MNILIDHFWLPAILITIINAFVIKFKSRQFISGDVGLKAGYENYFKGILLYGNIPWSIMMVGDLTGMTKTTLEYFNPKMMNPIVLIFHFSIIFIWVVLARWIYFKNGTEFIENHPISSQKSILIGKSSMTAKQIKLIFPITLISGIIGMVMMWTEGVPIN